MDYKARNKKVCEVPFNSTDKFQVSVHETDDEVVGYLVVMKGYPQRILERCSTIQVGGTEVPLSQDLRKNVEIAYKELEERGERVLGFCDMRLRPKFYEHGYQFDADEVNFPTEPMHSTEDLRFVGLVSMVDSVMASATDAISRCDKAGIKVIMVSGKDCDTSKAIARRVGVIKEDHYTLEELAKERNVSVNDLDYREAMAAVLDGSDHLKFLSDETLMNHSDIVFANTSKYQKLLILESYQNLGDVVAVIGDGVNDIPSLKSADIGVTMNKDGSSMSNMAADLVICNNGLGGLVTSVEEGRLVFHKLKRSIIYTLASIFLEILLFLLFLLFSQADVFPFLVITTVTFLCLALGLSYLEIMNLVSLSSWLSLMDILAGVVGSVVYQEEEGDVMERQPRNPYTEKLVTDRVTLIAVIVKVTSILVSGLIVMKSPSMFLVWIAIKLMSGYLPWIVLVWC